MTSSRAKKKEKEKQKGADKSRQFGSADGKGGADNNREADQTGWLFTDVLLLEFTSQVALDEGGLSGTAITD